MIQYEIKVTGRVQGVWFRRFSQEKAGILGIKGWVKNTPDGNVTIVAQGEKKDLETFLDYLKIGPPRARVDKIIWSEIQGLGDFNNFNVRC